MAEKKKEKHMLLRSNSMKACICAALFLVVAAIGLASCSSSSVPAGAAAQYNGNSYIYEDAVTSYIETYRQQTGYSDVSDEQWATFLSDYNMTPSKLRETTIKQLTEDELVKAKCKELGIEVSEDELQAQIDQMKSTYAYDDEDTWQKTLALYNITEDQLRENYRLQMLKDKLCESQVEMTTPTDSEVLSYAKTYASSLSSDETVTKHTYCFKISQDTDGTISHSTTAVQVHNALSEEGALTVESFATAVTMYSDDEELVATTGANGWDTDTSDYSQTYINYLEGLEVGQMSDVFIDEDGAYTIIYVDTSYTFPSTTAGIKAMTLESMPNSLKEYMADSCAYVTWYNNCENYIPSLLDDVNLVIYDMPSGLSYDVNMNLASNTSNSSTNSNSNTTSNVSSNTGTASNNTTASTTKAS